MEASLAKRARKRHGREPPNGHKKLLNLFCFCCLPCLVFSTSKALKADEVKLPEKCRKLERRVK
jgi:hypothetical protein